MTILELQNLFAFSLIHLQNFAGAHLMRLEALPKICSLEE